MCLELPPNCGKQGARCCPAGIYGPPSSPQNATSTHCTEPNVKCTGWSGMPGVRFELSLPFNAWTCHEFSFLETNAGSGVCEYWPSPPECGLPGQRCCPDPYHNWMEAEEPPPICQVLGRQYLSAGQGRKGCEGAWGWMQQYDHTALCSSSAEPLPAACAPPPPDAQQ